MNCRLILANLILIQWLLLSPLTFGDVIELRTGQKLSDAEVVSVNEDGILLAGGELVSFDRIRSASLKAQELKAQELKAQETFDRLYTKLGDDLFRLRIRLQKNDFENLQPHLARLFPVFENRSSESAMIVHLASLHHERLAGHFELAIRSHFRLVALAAKSKEMSQYLESLGYRYDQESGMSGQLCPFGFSQERVAKNWNSILSAYLALPRQHPHGLDFYFFRMVEFASMEVAPEVTSNRLQLTALEKILMATIEDAIRSNDPQVIESTKIRFLEHAFSPDDSEIHRALYYLVDGLLEAKRATGVKNDGLLQLLRIHAEFDFRTSAISAAGLSEVVKILQASGSQNDAKKVADELKSRYPSSIFAKQLKM